MPDISKITLPSGNTYDIKDATARQLISGGISFQIVWSFGDYKAGVPSSSKLATIPKGVEVSYSTGSATGTATGTLPASSDTIAKFYLIYSKVNESNLDQYDEYVTIEGTEGQYWLTTSEPTDWDTNCTSYFTRAGVPPVYTPVTDRTITWTANTFYSKYVWEKIGDTQIDFTDVVTGVTLNQHTTNFVTGYSSTTSDTVIGSDSEFDVTDPTITVTPTTTYVKASASGGSTAWNNKDQKSAVTGYSSPTSDTFLKSASASTEKLDQTTVIGVQSTTTSVTGVQSTTTSVIGVQSGTTTASKATAGTSQTTATGGWTAISASSTDANSNGNPDVNENLLANISVSNETLVIGAATLDTQTTTQFTFSDVTVPIKATSATTVPIKDTNATTVPIKDTNATTVATGTTSDSGTGDDVAVDVSIGTTASALTGLGTPTTANVIGASATFTITQPTISLATDSSSATGRVQVATGITSASASGTAVAWDNKDEVTVLTGLGTPTTSAGLDTSTSLTVSKGNQ